MRSGDDLSSLASVYENNVLAQTDGISPGNPKPEKTEPTQKDFIPEQKNSKALSLNDNLMIPSELPDISNDVFIDFSQRSLLKNGDIACVYKGHMKKDGNPIVAKQARLPIHNKKLISEAKIMNDLMEFRSDNIVNFLGIINDPEKNLYASIIEKYPFTLADYIATVPSLTLQEKYSKFIKYSTHICQGVVKVHQNRLIHFDLNPGNIFIDKNDNVRIGNFGLTRKKSLSESVKKIGTPGWMAPELFNPSEETSPAIDIYSIGCIFWSMLTGKQSLKNLSEKEIDQIFDECSEEIRRIIKSCMEKTPAKRPWIEKLFRDFKRIHLELGTVNPHFFFHKSFIHSTHVTIDEDKKKILGTGGMATVYQGRLSKSKEFKTSKEIAIKYFSESSNAIHEIQIMEEVKQIRSKNIVKYVGWTDFSSGDVAILMEKYPLTLTQLIIEKQKKQSKREKLEEEIQLIKYLQQVLDGLVHLEEKDFIHFDLTPGNIFIDKDSNARIGDFGFTRKTALAQHVKTQGTFPYMAPEVMQEKSANTKKINTYQIGSLLWGIVTGNTSPFKDLSEFFMIHNIPNGMREAIPKQCDSWIKKIIQDCWEADPDKRPTVREVKSRLEKAIEILNAKLLSFVEKQPMVLSTRLQVIRSVLSTVCDASRMPMSIIQDYVGSYNIKRSIGYQFFQKIDQKICKNGKYHMMIDIISYKKNEDIYINLNRIYDREKKNNEVSNRYPSVYYLPYDPESYQFTISIVGYFFLKLEILVRRFNAQRFDSYVEKLEYLKDQKLIDFKLTVNKTIDDRKGYPYDIEIFTYPTKSWATEIVFNTAQGQYEGIKLGIEVGLLKGKKAELLAAYLASENPETILFSPIKFSQMAIVIAWNRFFKYDVSKCQLINTFLPLITEFVEDLRQSLEVMQLNVPVFKHSKIYQVLFDSPTISQKKYEERSKKLRDYAFPFYQRAFKFFGRELSRDQIVAQNILNKLDKVTVLSERFLSYTVAAELNKMKSIENKDIESKNEENKNSDLDQALKGCITNLVRRHP